MMQALERIFYEKAGAMSETSSIYGRHLPEMESVMNSILNSIGVLRRRMAEKTDSDPIDHCLARIKTDESMRAKCRLHNLPETEESALNEIHDAIGIRIVCAFVSDVYTILNYLKSLPDISVVTEKDYIRHAKPNGYRSYHMIVRFKEKYYVEIQLRTISMDTWAALEHQLKYKKTVSGNEDLITSELKRCADELASTDVSMQTIRDMIYEEREN